MADRIPVTTISELQELEDSEILEGYVDGRSNEPMPGDNRSKAYWHGWRNGQVDGGHAKIDNAQMELVKKVVAEWKKPVTAKEEV
jgi:hypothetical protein